MNPAAFRALPAAGDVAALVRLPAVLTVPGDGWLGAAAAGHPVRSRSLVLAGSSACLYLSGMALNDWADREVDARERPGRPIPSGRVSPGFALALAAGLSVAGIALAGVAGGRRSLAVAVPLAGAVWSYDLALKGTPAGPLGMAACRSLDVLLGASVGRGRLPRALPAAAVVGAHTAVVTTVSRQEASGSGPGLAGAALAATTAVTGLAGALARHRLRGGRARGLRRAAAGALLGAYAGSIASAGGRALADPSPARLQALVGTGVLGLMPLEAGLLAAAGPVPAAAVVAGAWPLARRLARRRSVT